MTDRELLELAAKAAGIPGRYHNEWAAIAREDLHDSFGRSEPWRPLNDDGDAFRLMTELNIDVEFFLGFAEVKATPMRCDIEACYEDAEPDLNLATRRAIVRVAAAMGEQL